ncbi:dehydrogenase [Mesorhizobium sp. M00.F.Ca.ET.217.01.1.1]|nr:dehydrogenase [Mesorhizobium sp. M00.F.Ca.ET.217.01.1.1]
MKRTLTLIAIGLLCLTAAGCASTQSIKVAVPPPFLAQPNHNALTLCIGPVRLPKGELTQRDVERFWIADRKELLSCGRRFKLLRDFYQERDAAIVGGKVGQ